MRVAITLVCTIACVSSLRAADDLALLTRPITVRLPTAAARGWGRCDAAAPTTGGPLFAVTGRLELPARLDVLITVSGEWQYLRSVRIETQHLPSLPADGHLGLLLRSCGGGDRYGWADVDAARIVSPVQFEMQKTIDTPRSDEALLFVDGELEPRTLGRAASQFEHVPLRAGILCATGQGGARCGVVPADSTRTGNFEGGNGVRVFHLADARATPTLLASGVSMARPRTLTPLIQRAGRWVAITMPEGSGWASSVFDWQMPDAATVRFAGADLLPLPSLNIVPAVVERGVRVQATVGHDDEPVLDTNATLLLFPLGGPDLPLVIVHNDGTFAAPSLPHGRYRLKLVSATALSTFVEADLGSETKSVRFTAAPVVRGRVVLRGAPAKALVHILPRQQPPSDGHAGPEPSPDLVDAAREVATGEDGTFRVGIPGAGSYALEVTAGTARAEYAVTVEKDKPVTDMGDIALSSGATLRGVLHAPCPGGEMLLTPMPDLSRPSGNPPFFDFRRVPLQADGFFAAEGITAGSWLIAAKCNGEVVDVQPSPFNVSDDAVVVIDFSPVPVAKR